jgi:beta-glucosidase
MMPERRWAATGAHGTKPGDARARTDRTLFEIYLAPFEAAVCEASVWTVMAAYNRVNGHSMTESPLLADTLKRRWGS